jgi:hypothetical protein
VFAHVLNAVSGLPPCPGSLALPRGGSLVVGSLGGRSASIEPRIWKTLPGPDFARLCLEVHQPRRGFPSAEGGERPRSGRVQHWNWGFWGRCPTESACLPARCPLHSDHLQRGLDLPSCALQLMKLPGQPGRRCAPPPSPSTDAQRSRMVYSAFGVASPWTPHTPSQPPRNG